MTGVPAHALSNARRKKIQKKAARSLATATQGLLKYAVKGRDSFDWLVIEGMVL